MTASPPAPAALALSAAYRAGWDASGEGWNAEYPGDAHNMPAWLRDRDEAIAAIAAPAPAEMGEDDLAARDAAESEATKRYDWERPGPGAAAWGAFQAGALWQRQQNAHPPAPAAEKGRVGGLRAELTRIADDYHPDRPQDAALALDEMRAAIRSVLSGGAS